MRKDLTLEENWVVVEISTTQPHYYKTFREALHSPIRGHVMTEQYYKFHYEKGTSHVYEPQTRDSSNGTQ